MTYEQYELRKLLREKDIYNGKFIELVEDVLDRIDNPNEDEDIFQSIDDAIIYYDDQWTILKEYCQPSEANWEYAIENFIDLIFSVSAQLQKE